ncbi:1-acyl-sn-glycerol-3-phosphate acyltransferase [Schumannella sp. 10F1B-5-1]|uniref:lysophospholipid acyltransferase family protein n=1 Tax=Schumannella sp. 10F1B-5-1 TaxID=2590780 RepID=UPI00113141BF|nr:lysophospholipid acyltransferase family protein [Schumannella sp. 10F1B-5-1]TPW71495.1 1-acyl-sn-glycerol-3-phosphate acyltransferase [Schumannella sp. 10F1B-5-1]
MAAMKRDRFTSRPQAAARFVAQRLILKPVVWTVTKVTVIGREKVKKLDGSFVVVANHSSHLDAPLIMGGLPWKQARTLSTGVAADYFFDVWWRRGLTKLFFNAFAVERSGGQRRGESAKVLVQRGVSLLVFPEATRSRDGGRSLGAFNPGAAAIARSVGAPCVPIALIGAGLAHPRGSKWPGPGRMPVGMVIGDPMRPGDDESAADFMERVRDEIARMIVAERDGILGAEVAAELHGIAPGIPPKPLPPRGPKPPKKPKESRLRSRKKPETPKPETPTSETPEGTAR